MTKCDPPTALITGASTGIGMAIAKELATRGMRVLLIARNTERLCALVSEIEESGGCAIAFPCDVTDEVAVKESVAAIRGRFSRIDLLVNNAGKELVAPLQVQKADAAMEIMEVNVVALAMFIKATLRLLGEGSSIVNMASVAAIKGAPGMSVYAASKGAVVAFTKAMSLELASKKIRVNAIAPGIVRTEMTDRMFARYSPEQIAVLEASYPLGFGRPEDIAGVVAFLGSDDARWVTGQTIVVDGGYSV